MFNFKALALGTTLALSTIFGGMAPAQAETGFCSTPESTVLCEVDYMVPPVDTLNFETFMISGVGFVTLYTDGTYEISNKDGEFRGRYDFDGGLFAKLYIDGSYFEFQVPFEAPRWKFPVS